VQSVTNRNFGLIVAYLIPGFVLLWGVGFIDPRIAGWLSGSNEIGPTLAGVLYVTIASLGLGMTASAARWATIDQLHHATGLVRPRWTDRDLHTRIDAYTWLIENYYRYYQFYSNTLVSLVIAYGLWRSSLPDPSQGIGRIELALLLISAVLLAGSRSALSRYYHRAGDLLAEEHKELTMTNGGGHHEEKSAKQKKTDKEAKAVKADAGTTAKSKATPQKR
jgi:hypothetical protein